MECWQVILNDHTWEKSDSDTPGSEQTPELRRIPPALACLRSPVLKRKAAELYHTIGLIGFQLSLAMHFFVPSLK